MAANVTYESIMRVCMAGYAGQRVNMKRRLGQPFGVAFDDSGIFMAFGALGVYVPCGYGQKRFHGMRIVAIDAAGHVAVKTMGIFFKYRGMTLLADCAGGPEPVCRMALAYFIMMAGNATDPRVRSDGIFCGIDIRNMPAFVRDRPFVVADHAIVFSPGVCRNRAHCQPGR